MISPLRMICTTWRGTQIILRRRDDVSWKHKEMYPWNATLQQIAHSTYNIHKNMKRQGDLIIWGKCNL